MALPAPITVAAALQRARRDLPFLEARSLVCHALSVTPAQLASRPEQEIAPEQLADLRKILERRMNGEPIAYIVGEREFFGVVFKVTPAVLIPRPETETLIEVVLEKLRAAQNARILDLGTGCGNIAISLARVLPSSFVTGVEISPGALQLARANAERSCAVNLRLLQSDWFSKLAEDKFDAIIANPPYVAERDPHLTQGDLRFEPRHALVSGEDGLAAIRHIVKEARSHLSGGGWLLFEHGFDQARACAELLREAGFHDVFSANDLAGIPRVAGGRLTDRAGKS